MTPDASGLGRWLVVIGLTLAAIGGLVWLAGRSGLPLGRLPGDIRFGSGNLSCFVPLGTTLLLSLILTVLLNLVIRWLGK
jgi:hypothetical protein